MDAALFEKEVRQGLENAVIKLSQIDGFVLHGFNIGTEPAAGVTEFSADTRSNSDQVVRQMREWQRKTAKRMDAIGRASWKKALLRPCVRNDNPADFKFYGIVRVTHTQWYQTAAESDAWDRIEAVLMRLRYDAALLIGERLKVEPDAEVTISTRTDCCDRPLPIAAQ